MKALIYRKFRGTLPLFSQTKLHKQLAVTRWKKNFPGYVGLCRTWSNVIAHGKTVYNSQPARVQLVVELNIIIM